jgi:gluconokinase
MERWMNILAIEASTSSAKAMIYSTNAGIVDVHTIAYPQKISDIRTQDADGVLDIVFKCASEIVTKTNLIIDMIALASVWHSMLLLDEKRTPVQRISTWANVDGWQTSSKYRNKEQFRRKVYHDTGCNIHCKYPAWRFLHMKENGALDVDIEKCIISSLPEYMFEKFTDEIAVSKVTASGTGFLNIHTLNWDKSTLQFLGLKASQFSPLEEHDYTGALTPACAKKLGVSPLIPVLIPNADGGLNQIGEGGLNKGIMTVSIGTSAAIRLVVDEPLLPEKPATWCYYVGKEKYLVGAAISGAGSCVQWFKSKVCNNKYRLAELEKMLDQVEISQCPYFLPFINGEQSPGWLDERTGGFVGLRDNHALGHMYYSLLEGIIFNIYQCYIELVKIQSVPKEIVISGGIVNSNYWLSLFADIFQREICVSSLQHSSTIGAICVASQVDGQTVMHSDLNHQKREKRQPNIDMADVYKKRYAQYEKYYMLKI